MNDHKIARWWQPVKNEKILCTLCPRYCKIGKGQNGFCYIRYNKNGKLYTSGYGHPTGFALDPIEKKPLFHFLPGTQVLSFGTAGCNLGCKFCQNWNISKAKIDNINSKVADPETVVRLALKHNAPSIAYTYNEPTIFGEYVSDISQIARENNVKNVMVTAGYINKNARKEIYKFIDAANVDLKAFTEDFYFKLTSAHLEDILDTLLWLKHETDVWLEITTLLIPGKNDSSEEIKQMCNWILNSLGNDVPIHFTAFHPDFKMTDLPPTPPSTLINARNIALAEGVKFCYVGNIHDVDGQITYCPKCKLKLIVRDWHSVKENNLKNGICPNCNSIIPGIYF